MNPDQNYYILVGDRKTWYVSVEKKIWGFSEKTKGSWQRSKKGDLLAFYVTAPTKKIIGFGAFKNKFVDDTITWPEEKLSQESIWKYKINFSVIYLCKQWRNGIQLPKNIIVNQGRKKINKQMYMKLIKQSEFEWSVKIHA